MAMLSEALPNQHRAGQNSFWNGGYLRPGFISDSKQTFGTNTQFLFYIETRLEVNAQASAKGI